MHERTAHSTGAPVTTMKPEKFPRPTIGLDEPVEKWHDFCSSWNQYKEEYALEGKKLTRQLVACCSPELATSLSRVTGGKHFDLTEQLLLTDMKNLVVRFENPAVYVQNFLAMFQQPDEGVRHFLSRLRGTATHCDFTVRCSCSLDVCYADNVIRYKLVAGLSDEEIKENVLAAGDQTLEATVKLIESKEGAKKAKVTLSGSSSGQINKVERNGGKPYTHCGSPHSRSAKKNVQRITRDVTTVAGLDTFVRNVGSMNIIQKIRLQVW